MHPASDARAIRCCVARAWLLFALLLLPQLWPSAAPAQKLSPAVTPPRVSAGSSAPALPEFTQAQATVRQILSRDEFQPAQPTWWDRQLSRARLWLATLFMGVDRLTSLAPWLGRTLEWLLFLAAAVGLVVWLLRAAKRQRLRVALNAASARTNSVWDHESADWRLLAEQHAASGDWREAIHALYWAAILHLEMARAWRHNPTRTPREYVRLLPPDSAQRDALSHLTALLETAWYGLRPARAEQFEEAKSSFDRLAATDSAKARRQEAA